MSSPRCTAGSSTIPRSERPSRASRSTRTSPKPAPDAFGSPRPTAGSSAFAALVAHGDKAELEPIVVGAAHRSRGIGQALADVAVERARRDGVRQVFVRPVGRNEDALRFFRSVGFDAVARVELALDLVPGTAWHDGVELAGRRFRV